jgi:hypothetical protein
LNAGKTPATQDNGVPSCKSTSGCRFSLGRRDVASSDAGYLIFDLSSSAAVTAIFSSVINAAKGHHDDNWQGHLA